VRKILYFIVLCGFLAGCGEPAKLTAPSAAPPRQDVDPAVAAKSALSRDDLMKVLRDLGTYTPPDQFSPGFDPSGLKDKRIDLVFMAPSDGGRAGDDAHAFTWHYVPEKQELNASFNESAFVGLKYADDYGGMGGTRLKRSIPLGSAVVSAETATGQNGYGATRQMTIQTIEEQALAEFEKFKPNQGGLTAYLTWAISLPPEQARLIAPRLRVHVMGTIVPGRSGALAACETHKTSATLTEPQEQTHHTCYVSVRIDKIEFQGVPAGTKVVEGTI